MTFISEGKKSVPLPPSLNKLEQITSSVSNINYQVGNTGEK